MQAAKYLCPVSDPYRHLLGSIRHDAGTGHKEDASPLSATFSHKTLPLSLAVIAFHSYQAGIDYCF